MKYEEALEYIDKLSVKGIVPGLASVRELCKRLGNPQDRLKFVHIAGTNGKGSVLAYISQILTCAGYRTGRYLSPAVFDYRERFSVNGRMIPKKTLGEYMERVKDACDKMTEEGLAHPTPFEVETALAFLYFQEKDCEIVVLETGMGGLLDATNLITTTLVSVLTSIGMDHMAFLGKTIEQIAEQKTGIIKKGCVVVTGNQKEAVWQVIQKAAKEKEALLVRADASEAKHVKYGLGKQRFDYGEYAKLEIALAGRFQIDNSILALEAVQALTRYGFVISEKAIREGLRQTQWPGRFTVLKKKPLMIMDGAHNEDAAAKLRDSLDFYFTNKRFIYIMGMLKDKECEKVIALTCDKADQIITLSPPENARAQDAYALATMVREVNPNVTTAGSVEEAVEMAHLLAAPEDVIVAFGSLSYLGRLSGIVAERFKG